MNIFNKIIVVLMLIFIICLSVIGIFNSFVKVFKWSDMTDKILNSEKTFNPYISTLVLLLAIIFCIFLLVLEFYRKKAKVAIVAAVKEGTAMITLESAANQIKESLSKISGTADVFVRVVPKSNGVILNLKAKICSDCNVPEKMQEIIKGATNFTVNKLGIKVYKTNLTIFHLSNIQYEPADNEKPKNEIQKPFPVIIPEKITEEKIEPLAEETHTNNTGMNLNSESDDEKTAT
ncbi:MAG: Asp23/Gls24 family envelope stress response protein [Candidatus Humimicrobiaceae bacterium]